MFVKTIKILLIAMILQLVSSNGWGSFYDRSEFIKAINKDDLETFVTLFKRYSISGREEYRFFFTSVDRNAMKIINWFFSNGVSVNRQDDSLRTPLHRAASRGYLQMTKYLLEKGAMVDIPGGKRAVNGVLRKETALHDACRNGHFDVAKLLIEHGADVNAKNYQNFTPFHMSVQGGSIEMVQYLIEKGANINAQDSYVGFTPLHRAVRRGIKKVRLLVSYGANLSIESKKGETPYQFALRTDRSKIADFLKQAEKEQKAKRKAERKKNKSWWEIWK